MVCFTFPFSNKIVLGIFADSGSKLPVSVSVISHRWPQLCFLSPVKRGKEAGKGINRVNHLFCLHPRFQTPSVDLFGVNTSRTTCTFLPTQLPELVQAKLANRHQDTIQGPKMSIWKGSKITGMASSSPCSLICLKPPPVLPATRPQCVAEEMHPFWSYYSVCGNPHKCRWISPVFFGPTQSGRPTGYSCDESPLA